AIPDNFVLVVVASSRTFAPDRITQMEQNIYIIGAGAIGKALAVFLTHEGRKVFLLRSSVDNVSEQRQKLEVLTSNQDSIKAPVMITSVDSLKALDGVVVLANKSFANTKLAEGLATKIGKSPIVIMQNGLDVETPFLDDPFTDVYRCVLFSTSQAISDTVVRFKPVSASAIGPVRGDGKGLGELTHLIHTSHFPFAGVDDIKPIVWIKVIANCVFNSVCPLLEADNGIFQRSRSALAIAETIVDECLQVAQHAGVLLDKQNVLKTVLNISKSSDGQLISTLQDIRNKRPTEIESLNFAMVKAAERMNLVHTTPVTKLLGQLTKLKSDLSLQ
ncbi:MAG TPA: 2-dehydropantoate 2-reductase, partial [Chryseosolibacter sp.]